MHRCKFQIQSKNIIAPVTQVTVPNLFFLGSFTSIKTALALQQPILRTHGKSMVSLFQQWKLLMEMGAERYVNLIYGDACPASSGK